MSNFYDELLNDIKKAIDDNDFENALKLINTELSMPYIPENVESDLLKYLKIIRTEQNKNLFENNNNFNIDKIREMLNSKDTIQQMIAIKNLASVNIRLLLDDVKKYLISKNNSNDNKTFLLLALSEQDINIDFKVLKDKEYIINPTQIDVQSIDLKIEKIENKLIEFITDKNPSLIEMSKQILFSYFLNSFPNIDLDDINEITTAVLYTTYEINSIKLDLEQIKTKISFNKEKVDLILKVIKESGAFIDE
ncbi:DUF3196 family protein [Mycoplasma yeatsii]|uniref:Uncharacterized protein n=1 Tax=Mycoplasma yeatsii TaxID=51365 RepID=A0ABU0NEG2_9MOLU|nr:DUF3196 family protein [Mycoplasma yeatsii]MDQ0567830.1 hypothetical protein [Mycoplasma yeatsii]